MPRAPEYRARRRIRIVGFDQAEVYCYGCRSWWPVTLEFWPTAHSFDRCRACDRERTRLYEIARMLDPEQRIANIAKSRRYRDYIKGREPQLWEAYLREARLAANARQTARRKALAAAEGDRLERQRRSRRDYMRRRRAAEKVAKLTEAA